MAKAWFTVKKLYPFVWGIAEFGHYEEVVSYLFVGKKEALLFDTGMGIGDIEYEVRRITDLPIRVVNSHSHYDHIGGNRKFSVIEAYGMKWSNDRARVGYTNTELAEIIRKENFFSSPPQDFIQRIFNIPPYSITHSLQDGEEIYIDPFTFVVLHTPGHTPDSLCLFEKTTKVLLTGDTLYDGPIFLYFPESSCTSYKKSIEKLVSLTQFSVLLPAHNSFFLDPSALSDVNESLSGTKAEGKAVIVVSGNIILRMRATIN